MIIFKIAFEFNKICTSAKLLAGPCDDQHAHREIRIKCTQCMEKVGRHLWHHAVTTIRAVQRDHGDAIRRAFQNDRFVSHQSCNFI
jgi:hypothetical protein